MVRRNIHFRGIRYSHYDESVKRVASDISPIIAIDRNRSKALHRQIYEAYRRAILDRTLRPGQRVPSTRMLAADLHISRIPVLNAYSQLLAEGYFQSRVGAGTVVCNSLPDQIAAVPQHKPRAAARNGLASRAPARRSFVLDYSETVPWQRGWGPFGCSQVALDQFPFHVWNSLIARHCRNSSAGFFDYGNPLGARELREAISDYVRTARGVRCEADQIMIVSGSQQAVEITTRVLLDPGSPVWMEEPGYRFARNVFKFHGCKIVPVPVDNEGLNVAAGIKQCRTARAAFVTPSHQYPLGLAMSASRRLQLLEWAERFGSWIIEDDYDSEYRYESLPILSLQGMDETARVVYIGTFSKVLFPSLRLGYLVIPPDLVEHFVAARFSIDISPAIFHQLVLADFIREGHFSRHLRRMRLLYGQRRATLIESIRSELGSRAEITGSEAGMHLALTVRGIRDREIAALAARQKLWLAPLSSSYLHTPCRTGFILGFGSTSAEQIPKAVGRLRDLVISQ